MHHARFGYSTHCHTQDKRVGVSLLKELQGSLLLGLCSIWGAWELGLGTDWDGQGGKNPQPACELGLRESWAKPGHCICWRMLVPE